jgi:hypothetical protein
MACPMRARSVGYWVGLTVTRGHLDHSPDLGGRRSSRRLRRSSKQLVAAPMSVSEMRTTLGPHAMHPTGQSACQCTDHSPAANGLTDGTPSTTSWGSRGPAISCGQQR